jgi:hypothetical protein
MGIRSEWRHNKQGLAKKLGVVAGVSALLFVGLRARRGRRDAALPAPENAGALPAVLP